MTTPPDRPHALKLLRDMIRIRRFEEKAVEIYSQGKIRGFLHLYIGEEAVAAGAIPVIRPDDAIVGTYREHGHALMRGTPMGMLMAELYGKANGCSRGRGGSMHFFDAARRFYGGLAIVAGGLPIAVGLALADKIQKRSRLTACFFGDGAVAEGEFHESMNLAALWKLPVLFMCENNLYAMGTKINRYESQTEIAVKAKGYGMPGEPVDGMDVVAVQEATQKAADWVRAGNGPYLLEFQTYRFRAHSMYDPELYRSKEEIERWKEHGPIKNLEGRMREWKCLTNEDLEQIEADITREIDDAVAFAEAGEWEPVEDLTKDVYTGEGKAEVKVKVEVKNRST